MILITKTFKKLLDKIKSVGVDDIKIKIDKHKSGLENFIEIGKLKNRKVLKGYLFHKKVRILVLFQEKNGNYLPFYIIKKERKYGKNITKDSLNRLSGNLDNIFEDLENNNYKIID
ncbi:MAG: hypothetical protein QM490_04275 [Candidatus Gracilibacteria bacterium]